MVFTSQFSPQYLLVHRPSLLHDICVWTVTIYGLSIRILACGEYRGTKNCGILWSAPRTVSSFLLASSVRVQKSAGSGQRSQGIPSAGPDSPRFASAASGSPRFTGAASGSPRFASAVSGKRGRSEPSSAPRTEPRSAR